jgi:D-glycero-D-manno-heptose 1,7-bisphosphate phosphatase
MVEDAAKALNLDVARSWVIGDYWRDVELAHRAGAKSVLVRSGHGAAVDGDWPADIARPTLVADNLIAAVAALAGSNPTRVVC